jgi:transcriptional regulator with XRE-family HTH domain
VKTAYRHEKMEDNKKFRYTKQLVGMALRDGWTQKQIADACRTQQSVVSAWKNGSKQAQEGQLKKLLDLYGSKLRRRTAKVYHSFLSDQGTNQVHMIKVEGEVIFTFPYRNKEFCPRCATLLPGCSCYAKDKRVSHTRRLVVHAMGKGEFCLVAQSRLIKDEYQKNYPETNIYNSSVMGRFSAHQLLEGIDSLGAEKDGERELDPAEHLMAQMLIRKALLEQGYSLEGVEEHLAAW